MKKKSRWGVLLIFLLVLTAAAGCGGTAGENPAQDTTLSGAPPTDQEPAGSVEKTAPEGTKQGGEDAAEAPDAPAKKEVSPQAKEDPVQAGESGQKEAPAPKKEEEKNLVTLKVTRDFGVQPIFEKKITFQKEDTILDLLQDNLDIETDWDGGFIKGINGLVSDKGGLSGKRTDWFYYVNGVCADVGADGYRLHPGETVWWDYHLWASMGSAISAVIGSYPEPFLHGYGGKAGGTTVLCAPEKEELGEKVKKALEAQGVKTVKVSGLEEEKIKKRTGPLVVLGEWQELNGVKWLEDFNKAYRKTGTGVHFTDQGLELVKYNGAADRTLSGSGGVIVATGSGLGDEMPLWLIGGTDEKGLEQAVNVLVESPEKISGLYGAAVTGDEIIRLPVQ
ncbi:DUF4430 domain-containing protein [Candidatus Formimonas warabiya]|uniref:Transcobalamin-like C-terminal domain-containing protein n=1 Tax=Formimonas warabiya TaxID=1761012 RepID=A0A3G1KYM2_FORW1|nr:DUF4430 domain-containing protein [Candidatus Formimonas warabiya]ATW27578.1 hypothetical protein DCMF_25010 [Candidatus Formimonas warabiya]